MTQREYHYWLPDENGNRQEQSTKNNAVIIIGANGAGKSHLGAWIERNGMDEVHRIASQRSLNFSINIPLKNYSQAECNVLYGTDEAETNKFYKDNKTYRWGNVNGSEDTIKFINDFDSVLSALIAAYNNHAVEYYENSKAADKEGKDNLEVTDSVLDQLYAIWCDVFPQRRLIYSDSKFYATADMTGTPEDQIEKYPANKMSDGERSVLYFTAQVLCVPQDKILIIDEPELHMHKSLMNRLWKALEQYRRDLLFIYITHDTDFAANHFEADKIWVKSYDGHKKWELEHVEDSRLPESLLLQLLGNRKKVIFVEGDANSYDLRLYRAIYRDYYVVPCSSCHQVISITRAFKQERLLTDFDAYGIIDRDYRTEDEIDNLKSQGIYALNVAEVENLFVTDEVLAEVAHNQGQESKVSDARNIIIDKKFKGQIDAQICDAVKKEIEYRLSHIGIDGRDSSVLKDNFTQELSNINVEAIVDQYRAKFNGILNNRDYTEILKVFNDKNIAKSIGDVFGIKNNDYINLILRKVENGDEKFVRAIAKYLPSEIGVGENE